jgi:hypothetical protein
MTHTAKLILDKPARGLVLAAGEGHPLRVIRWPWRSASIKPDRCGPWLTTVRDGWVAAGRIGWRWLSGIGAAEHLSTSPGPFSPAGRS